MTDFLNRLLNVPVPPGARASGFEWVWGGISVWWLVLGAGLGAFTWWIYHKEQDLPLWKWWLLTGLRAGIFLLLVILILQPSIRVKLEEDIREIMIVMIDSSLSMKISDARTEPVDQYRAQVVQGRIPADRPLTDFSASSEPVSLSRIQLVAEALTQPSLDLLNRLRNHYDLRIVTFGETVNDLLADSNGVFTLEKVEPLDSRTALGDAIRVMLNRSRGQPLAGMLVISDGASNAGVSPLTAASECAREGVPIHAWGVGITVPKDIQVISLSSKDVAFTEDELPVVVTFRASGLSGQEVKFVIRLGDHVVAQKAVRIESEDQQQVTIPFTPDQPGRFKMTVSVEPLPAEVIQDNNHLTQDLRVVEEKIKVLYIEQQPRWEFKYLQAILLRDRRIYARFILLEADKSVVEGEGSPYLAKIPPEKSELFKYDLIIIGDVDPGSWTSEQMEALDEFVSKFGGTVLMLAGRRFSPQAYKGTVLEKILPVEWENDRSGLTVNQRFDRPIHFELTAAGRLSELLRLSETDNENERKWSNLPPLYWVANISRAKPAAEVLLVDSDPQKASRFGKMPLIARQQYGLGTTFYMGTDNLWRWRKNAADTFHARLWGQIIQGLALPHLLGESRRIQLTSDKKSYGVGDRMTLYARLYNDQFEPLTDATVGGTLTHSSGRSERVIFRQMPEQQGMYRAEMTASVEGDYRLIVDPDPAIVLDLSVISARMEFTETGMNELLMRQISELTKGRFLREEDLYGFPDSIEKRVEKKRSSLDVEIWSSPLFFLLILAMLTAEWILRKTAYLK